MRSIIWTDSTGYFPTAVSAESITASVPSKMAFATSEASARVGSGFMIIDSSICVAVITSFARAFAVRMIYFEILAPAQARVPDLDRRVPLSLHPRYQGLHQGYPALRAFPVLQSAMGGVSHFVIALLHSGLF